MFPTLRDLEEIFGQNDPIYVDDDPIVSHTQALQWGLYRPGYAYKGQSLVLSGEFGLIAARDIPRGTEIASYGGRMITEEEAEQRPRTAENAYIVSLPDGMHAIDGNPALPESDGHIGMFANDARGTGKKPNAQIEIHEIDDAGETRFYAAISTTTPVAAGEEILLNYGKDYWEESDESSGEEWSG